MSEDLGQLKADLAALAGELKANHLKAAKALAEGKTQQEAYLISGGKAKDSYAGASEMLRLNPKISQYVNLVQRIAAIESLPKQIASREQKRQMLWDIATKASLLKATLKGSEDDDGEGGLEVFDASAAKTAVAAIAELNKMDGDIAATKTNISHSGSIETTADPKTMTDEQLAAIIAQAENGGAKG